MAEKLKEFLVPMPFFALGDDIAVGDVQSGEQGCGAVAKIIVGVAFQVTEPHGKRGLCTLQGLALALLVHAQDQGVCGRIQIQSDYVADLLNKEGVGGEFEGSKAVRLESEGVPDALNGGLGYPGFGGDVPASPVGSLARLGADGLLNQSSHLLVGNAPRSARAQLVVQPLHALLEESLSPLPDSGLGQIEPAGNLLVVVTLVGQQNNAHPIHDAVGHRGRVDPDLQLLSLLTRQLQLTFGTTGSHGFLLLTYPCNYANRIHGRGVILMLITYGTIH